MFITSKIWPQDFGYEKAKKWMEHTFEMMGLNYLDLYLIYQPYGDYYIAAEQKALCALSDSKQEIFLVLYDKYIGVLRNELSEVRRLEGTE